MPDAARRRDEAHGGVRGRGAEQAVYVISVAAELTGMHPQTLRIYERKGLLSPARTVGAAAVTRNTTSSSCGASKN